MNNEIQLKGPINENSFATEQLIFFLHGWGSDGNDLIQISHIWEKEIKNKEENKKRRKDWGKVERK